MQRYLVDSSGEGRSMCSGGLVTFLGREGGVGPGSRDTYGGGGHAGLLPGTL